MVNAIELSRMQERRGRARGETRCRGQVGYRRRENEGDMRWRDGSRGRPSGPKGGISIYLELLCGCIEVLTDSVALLFSVPGVTQQWVGVFQQDTSATTTLDTVPLSQQEDRDLTLSFFVGSLKPFVLYRECNVCMGVNNGENDTHTHTHR